MTQRICRALYPVLTGLLLLGGLTACSRGQESTPPASGAGTTPPGAALYGVNVDIRYSGVGTNLGDTAMVYVFLRKPGTRMPLAVQHFPAGELPKTVSFAGTGQADAVELVVRLSPSGRVDASPEDVESILVLPGLLHPPQTVAVLLGADSAAAVAETTGRQAPPGAAVAIRTRVQIEADNPFGAESVVFVIAKRPGQAMPSAVKRLTVGELPAEIELTDADAMSFSNRLSDADRLELSARVSLSGTASRSEADWLSDIVQLETDQLPEQIPLMLHPPGGS